MIDTKLLRQKLIDMAMRGLLVEQRQEEGNASDLLEEIRAEKAALIKKGQIKKEKPLPEIKEEEKPFAIPDSWCWVRLGEICKLVTKGTTPRGGNDAYVEYGVGFLRAENVCGYDKLDLSNLKFIDQSVHVTDLRRSVLESNDILITIAGTLGRTGMVRNENLPLNTNQAISIARLVNVKYTDIKFIIYLLNGSFTQSYFDNSKKTTAIPNLTLEIVSNVVVPLPPLAEQKRIVAALEASLKLVDTIAKDSVDLDKALKFLRQKVLDMAMRGLLVEQRPEEGNASDLLEQIRAEKAALIKKGQIKKEKPLPEIKEEEKPFTIPDSWCWVRLGEIVINRDSERVPLAEHEREGLDKVYDYYGASGVIDKVDRYLFSERLLLIGEDGANLLTRTKPIAFIAEGFYWVNNHAHVLQNTKALELNYLCYYINSISLVKYVTGTAQPKMNQLNMNKILVPLPPLAEQKRIVAKLEQINVLIETALN